MIFNKLRNFMLVFFLFCLMMVSFVVANVEYTSLKNDWYSYDQSFTIGTDLYRVSLFPSDFNVLKLKQNDINKIIKLDDCVDEGDFRFCYKNYSFDKKADIDSKGNLMPGIHVEILKTKEPSAQKIAFKSSISGNTFLHHTNEANFSIKNNEASSFLNAELIIDIPVNVSITNSKDFTRVSNNQLKKSFSLQKDAESVFKFEYVVLSEGNKKFDYKIIQAGKTIQTSSVSSNGVLPYQVVVTAPTKANIQDILDFEVLVKNTHPSSNLLIETLNIKGPVNVQYITHQRLNNAGVGLFSVQDLSINPGQEQKFTFRYKPLFSGNYSFDVAASLNQIKSYSISQKTSVDVKSEGFSAGLLFSRKKISQGVDNTLVLTLKNDHSTLAFKDIKARIVTDFFEEEVELALLNSGSSVNIFEKKFTPQIINESKEYQATATISYTDGAGLRKTITLSDTFKIVVNESLVSITHKPTSVKGAAGDEIIVEVLVKNLVDNMLNGVEVKDSFSQKIDIVSGKQSNVLNLNANEEKSVYIYKLKIPQKPYSEELIIRTVARIPIRNYEELKTTKVTITGDIYPELAPVGDIEFFNEDDLKEDIVSDPDVVVDPIEETTNDDNAINNNDNEQELAEEKQDGFLKRLVLNIEKFFNNIFN